MQNLWQEPFREGKRTCKGTEVQVKLSRKSQEARGAGVEGGDGEKQKLREVGASQPQSGRPLGHFGSYSVRWKALEGTEQRSDTG